MKSSSEIYTVGGVEIRLCIRNNLSKPPNTEMKWDLQDQTMSQCFKNRNDKERLALLCSSSSQNMQEYKDPR